MKAKIPTRSGWMLTIAALLCVSSGPVRAGEFKVVEVCSGDRIRVEGYGAIIQVKLAGIDAPEIAKGGGVFSQPCAEESRGYLSNLILDRRVEITGHTQERHNVFVADVYMDDEWISLKMVESGLAEVAQYGLPEEFDLEPLRRAEAEAKAAGRGIWELSRTYVSPREWRRRERARAACAVILFGMCGNKEE
jgi:endonuclease YncB( thermonuclease family)